MRFLSIAILFWISKCRAEPETVDGLIEKKRPSSPYWKKSWKGIISSEAIATSLPPFRRGFIGGRKISPFLKKIWEEASTMGKTSTRAVNNIDTMTTTGSFLTSSSPSPKVKKNEAKEGNVNGIVPAAALKNQGFDEDKKGSIGIIIGIAFIAVFVGIVFGLVVHHGSLRLSSFRGNDVPDISRKRNRDIDDEDITPPELRGLGSRPSFVQPDANNGDLHSNDQSPPFFYGKLMLKDSPTGQINNDDYTSSSTASLVTNKVVNSMTSMFLAAQEAMTLPSPSSPARNDITKDLMIMDPKYDGSEDDEEESDDTVYECPGLASPGEMEVTNPFYLQGKEAFSVQDDSQNNIGEGPIGEPKPISQCGFLHHGIKGFN